jgi:sulfoquinovosidase
MISRVRPFFAVTVALFVACSKSEESQPPGPAFDLSDGAVRVHVETRPFRFTIFDGTRTVLASRDGGPAATFDEFIVSAKGLPGWDGYEEVADPWARSDDAAIVEKANKTCKLRFKVAGGTIDLDLAIEGMLVRVKSTASGISNNDGKRAWNKSAISFAFPADEHVFGLGERYASVDHRGLSLYTWAEEAGLGNGESAPLSPTNPTPNGPSMTYFPVPFYLSSKGYGMQVRSTYRSEHHFGSEQQDALRVAVSNTTLELAIYVNSDPLATLDAYTKETGRPLVPPQWVFGPRRRVSRSYMVGGVPEWKAIRDNKIPTTALDDALHFLPAQNEVGVEAELKTWTETLHANGYKSLCYYNPYVAKGKPDFEFGKSKGFFLKDPAGEPGITSFVSGTLLDVATIDLTNPAAVDWFHTLLKRSVTLGYDGWMHDFGEYVNRKWTASNGMKGDELHNLFPVLSVKAAHDFWRKERPGDYVYFNRSGYTGTQAFTPATWGGDPEATFDETQGLPATVRGGLNLALVGVAYWGSDISGFKCFDVAPRDKEVFFRWAEVGAVSPIMMDQNNCYTLTGKKEKWTLWSDAESTALYARMSRLHTRLQPYFLTLAREANARGIPLMRHPFLLHPNEPKTWSIQDSFFLGPALYTSPVVRRGAREKKTWLPPGRKYIDLDDNKVYEPGDVTIAAPLDKLPLLLVQKEILPMLDPTIETLAPATEPSVVTLDQVKDRLDVIVALAKGDKATLTLADGTVLTAERADGTATLMPADETTIATCDGCALETPGRTRVSSSTTTSYKDLRLSVSGGSAKRIRWDVRLL